MKKILIISAILVLSIVSIVFASGQLQEVFTNRFPIKINGAEYTPEKPVLSYQGSTYLALREFGTATNNKIDFADGTILIDTPQTIESLNLVYVSKSGKKYHYDEHCNGATYHRTPLTDAINVMQLEPCEKCVLKGGE